MRGSTTIAQRRATHAMSTGWRFKTRPSTREVRPNATRSSANSVRPSGVKGPLHWLGLGRCRYLGLRRFGIQAQLSAMVLNLKLTDCCPSDRSALPPRCPEDEFDRGVTLGFGVPTDRQEGASGPKTAAWELSLRHQSAQEARITPQTITLPTTS